MENFIKEQENILDLIKKLGVNYKKAPKVRLTKGYITTRLETLNQYFETFRSLHSNITKSATTAQREIHVYFTEDWYSQGEESYFEIKADMQDKLETFRKPERERNEERGGASPDVKLPVINIPKFTGNYHEWPTFRDLYKSMIHGNNSLSQVQKLHYLKSAVSGEAEDLIKHVQITEKNYDVAWDILTKRYNNKRVIVNSILSKLVNQRNLTSATASGVKNLLDTTVQCINNLKNNEILTHHWDTLIIYLIVNKLDDESRKEWEEDISSLPIDTLPSFQKFANFLETRFRILEMVQPKREKITTKPKTFVTTSPTTSFQCPLCKENHGLFTCKEFTEMSVDVCVQYVQTQRLCFNCLSPKHSAKYCKSKVSCHQCQKRHHTLLHFSNQRENQNLNNSNSNNENNDNNEKQPVITRTHLTTQGQNALMATALVNLRTNRGLQVVRALIDPCSQESFICEATAQRLQLPRKEIEGHVTGVDQMTTRLNYLTELEICSRTNSYTASCTAFIVKKVTDILPTQVMRTESWNHLQHLTLADPTYHKPGSIDMLLGVNIYTEILMSGIIRGEPGSPIAQQTQLGWIISGGVSRYQNTRGTVSMHLNVSLETMLQKFWETEKLPSEEKDALTPDEIRAEKIYNETARREPDGRYIVGLPFKRDEPILPEKSKAIALKRLSHLETKLSNNIKLRREYNEVMREYLTLKHMEPVKENERKKKERVTYLPHHAVVREDKDTTKVRVVFDASCKGTNGVSLNDELLIGPPLQEELRDILLRWRLHKICFIADIIKMYRQVRVREGDVDFQRILWRFNTNDTVHEYRLLTVTFGMASAPYLAIKTLKQLRDDKLPLAEAIVNSDFYVDDVLSGSHDEETAIEAQRQLTELLRQGGFQLQKWFSNSKKFMDAIEPEKRSNVLEVDINRKESTKALGITWNVREDNLQVTNNVNLLPERNITKRNVLAVIASLYDPMGWLAPAVVIAKIFMQKLWKIEVHWDEDLPENYCKEWIKFRSEIQRLTEITVPRWIGTTGDLQTLELHGFADASATAYAAVIYSRAVTKDEQVIITLLMAKTKVSPCKQITLPRLELNAALLLSRLLKHVAKAMMIEHKHTYAWSDSKVVLSWIEGDPLKWKTYVKNRVIEINNTINTTWSYVNTKENPADPASRGVAPEKLKEHTLWWNGPSFLQERELNILTCSENNIPDTELEKQEIISCATILTENENETLTLLKRYSSLKKLLAVVAYCRRWLHLKEKTNIIREIPKYVTYEEKEEALTICLLLSQTLEFEEDIKRLKQGKQLKKGSRLTSLTPFLDEKGVLRVGGRLKHADLEFLSKHPAIISSNNVLLPLLLNEAHANTMHGGPQMMTTYLRGRYWLINANNTVKRFVRNCMICAKQGAITKTQLMGNLPEFRVKPSRPFSISGVDFAGPINVRMSKGRGAKSYKAYIALFICMATKAIHVELVSDMTTDAFMAAYRRFMSRRGRCLEMWSDHGTTFVSASKEILEMWRQGQSSIPQELCTLLDRESTKWRFIPPGAPNFGGLWEAGVKSIKFHMKRVIGDSTLTFEEMSTLLAQIEACLNSRPLSPLSNHPADFEPLTPAHFLIGEPLVTIAERDYTDVTMHSLTRWQMLQKMMQAFWRKWQTEYMSRLQQRPKWTNPKKELEIGELVLIKDTRCPPSKWLLGRITAKYPGKDKLTRTYDVKTSSGKFTRSITKLCALPSCV